MLARATIVRLLAQVMMLGTVFAYDHQLLQGPNAQVANDLEKMKEGNIGVTSDDALQVAGLE